MRAWAYGGVALLIGGLFVALLELPGLEASTVGILSNGGQLLAALLRDDHELGLLFCDLDDFKAVNDEHGHDIGDLLLRDVASRLLTCVRAQDTVARLGGDEFAVLLEPPDSAEVVAQRVVEAMSAAFELRGTTLHITMSVGVAHHHVRTHPGRRATDAGTDSLDSTGTGPSHSRGLTGADPLLRVADQAMYAARTSGKGRAVVADDEADAHADRDLHVEADIA